MRGLAKGAWAMWPLLRGRLSVFPVAAALKNMIGA